jgi:hypothetical protein
MQLRLLYIAFSAAVQLCSRQINEHWMRIFRIGTIRWCRSKSRRSMVTLLGLIIGNVRKREVLRPFKLYCSRQCSGLWTNSFSKIYASFMDEINQPLSIPSAEPQYMCYQAPANSLSSYNFPLTAHSQLGPVNLVSDHF